MLVVLECEAFVQEKPLPNLSTTMLTLEKMVHHRVQPEVTLDGYTLFRSDRAEHPRGGGVALYVKSLLMPTHLAIDATNPCVEMVGCQFSLPSRHITVLLVYKSPCSTESDDDIVLRVLRTVARLHGEYLILGDFNAPHVNWLTRSCSIANSFSNKLLTAADEEFLHQALTSSARYRTGQLPCSTLSSPSIVAAFTPSITSHHWARATMPSCR